MSASVIDPKEASSYYLPMLYEMTLRIELIPKICEGSLGLPPAYAREYAYLQLRRICELVALGCLILNGSIPGLVAANKKEWHAEKIFKILLGKHAHAFPRPLNTRTVDGVFRFEFDANPNALTFDEFRMLYNECGEVLHRGTIKSISSEGIIDASDLVRVLWWQSKIISLLNQHAVWLHQGDRFFWVSLRVESGYPEMSLLSKDGEDGLRQEVFKMTVAGDGMPAGVRLERNMPYVMPARK